MGRVVAQDLKQVCARRIRAEGRGSSSSVPVLAVFDEFAALRRRSRSSISSSRRGRRSCLMVISTQYLPESIPLRRACLGAGLLIAHRVETEDAEVVAVRRSARAAARRSPTKSTTRRATPRRAASAASTSSSVHPNELRTFNVGQVAYKSVPKRRFTICQVSLA